MSSRRAYNTGLSDEEWELLKPLVLGPKPGGRPRAPSTRVARRHLLRGQGWLCLAPLAPRLPAVEDGYHYFRAWRLDGTWEEIHAVLRELLRRRSGRDETPSAAIVDSQSAKTTEQDGPRGYDGAKKVNGRKRHLLVDTGRLVMKAKAHPADLADRDGARMLLDGATESFPNLSLLWADAGYRGAALREWITDGLGLTLEIVQRRRRWRWIPPVAEPPLLPAGFEVIKRRWVVERTFAWICRNRRMSKDYERLGQTTEVLIYVVMIRLMLKRLSTGTV